MFTDGFPPHSEQRRSASTPASALARSEQNGRLLCICCPRCQRLMWHPISSASTQPSVHAKRPESGRWPCTCYPKLGRKFSIVWGLHKAGVTSGAPFGSPRMVGFGSPVIRRARSMAVPSSFQEQPRKCPQSISAWTRSASTLASVHVKKAASGGWLCSSCQGCCQLVWWQLRLAAGSQVLT